MISLYRKFLKKIDADFLMKETENLWRREFPQTFKAYHEAAFYTKELVEKAGLPNVELIELPADGKTAFLDNRMPIAWDASCGRLTLLNCKEKVKNNPFGNDEEGRLVAADFQKHPFSLVKGSVLPGGKRTARIISETQLLSGIDAEGTIVLLDKSTRPYGKAITMLLDLGAIGFLADNVTGGLDHPDSIGWFNAACESDWHVTAAHRPFVGFSTTPRIGDYIREQLKRKAVMAQVECDGVRYVGVHHAVTALIPGRRKEEVWAYGHLYEPLADDDSCGVVAAIETAKQIMAEGTPEYSVRVVFAMELYGFAAFIGKRMGGDLRKKVIGALNYDGLASILNVKLKCYTCPMGTPCFGNFLIEELTNAMQTEKASFTCKMYPSAYFDDIAFNCPSVGLAAIWALCDHGDTHHTSRQEIDILDKETFAQGTAFNTALVSAMANPDPAMVKVALSIAKEHVEKHLADVKEKPFGSDLDRFRLLCDVERTHLAAFGRVLPSPDIAGVLKEFDDFCASLEKGLSAEDKGITPIRTAAEKIVMQYTATGFPHSLAKTGDTVPFGLPDGCIYGPFSNVLANLHTPMSVAEAIRRTEYERGTELNDSAVKSYINGLNRLADAGYLRVISRPELGKEEIVKALQALGVKKGDVLLVHSSVSNCGYIKGGAETVIASLEEAVGKEGTLLFAAFTRPYMYLGGPCREWLFRPYDGKNPSQIWTGTIPKTVLKRADALRSRHATHSWCGFGPLAETCLMQHAPDDNPASINSPMGVAMEHGAKILHFGSAIASTTFLHLLEDVCNVPFLGNAVAKAKKEDGTYAVYAYDKHLPGHRDFYCGAEAEKKKFYTRAIPAGLTIKREKLGTGELLLMDCQEYFRIGKKIVDEDYTVLLCDDPSCAFCSRFRKK
ncbi:MAG: DUF4910 domain-containing protein [Lentisphaeria bacterium]|nr:DUF4910 domain-containing protein [Lentisphaeria bacterium]